MATAPDTTGAPTRAPDTFKIIGTSPFNSECPSDYVEAAYAVALLASANFGEADGEPICTSPILMAGFDAIALLLACAERCRLGAHS